MILSLIANVGSAGFYTHFSTGGSCRAGDGPANRGVWPENISANAKTLPIPPSSDGTCRNRVLAVRVRGIFPSHPRRAPKIIRADGWHTWGTLMTWKLSWSGTADAALPLTGIIIGT